MLGFTGLMELAKCRCVIWGLKYFVLLGSCVAGVARFWVEVEIMVCGCMIWRFKFL